MQTIDWVTTAIAVIALAISAWSFFHDRNRQKTRDEFERRSTQEAAENQRQLLEIEETRHRWEQEQRNDEESTQRRTDEEARTAAFTIRFGYRDSNRTWARIIATNNGPANARDVELEVFAEKGGRRVDIEPIRGEDYLTAERERPLRYRLLARVPQRCRPPIPNHMDGRARKSGDGGPSTCALTQTEISAAWPGSTSEHQTPALSDAGGARARNSVRPRRT